MKPSREDAQAAGAGAAQRVSDFAVAAAQIDLAIAETLHPVQTLGGALETIGQLLATLEAAYPQREEWVHSLAGGLRAQLAVCIQSLQFHDCLVQHLSHVRDYLAQGAGAEAGGDHWPPLRRRLRARLITDDQRALFDLLTGSGDDADARVPGAIRDRPLGGSIELF